MTISDTASRKLTEYGDVPECCVDLEPKFWPVKTPEFPLVCVILYVAMYPACQDYCFEYEGIIPMSL